MEGCPPPLPPPRGRCSLQLPLGLSHGFLGLRMARDSHCCDMTVGVRPIFSPARPSSPVTGGDAGPRHSPPPGTSPGTAPSPSTGPLWSRSHNPLRNRWPRWLPAAAGHPGRRASQPIPAGSGCPATGPAARRGGVAMSVGRAGAEAGPGGELPIREKAAFSPVPPLLPGLGGERTSQGKG